MTLRCPACRSRRATFTSLVAHVKASGHQLCYCSGYWYPHRPTGGCCDQNVWSALRQAQRRGDPLETQMDIAADIAFEARGKPMKEW